MGLVLPALLSLLPIFSNAGKLTLYSPRVSITGADASIIRNEPYEPSAIHVAQDL